MITEIKKILYATDLSKNSAYAFFYAADMAKRHNAKIIILHAIEPIRPVYAEGEFFRVEAILGRAKNRKRRQTLRRSKNVSWNFVGRRRIRLAHAWNLYPKSLFP